MCWRDDIVAYRWCIICGQKYYGDLGHRECPGFPKKPPETSESEIKYNDRLCAKCGLSYYGDHFDCPADRKKKKINRKKKK